MSLVRVADDEAWDSMAAVAAIDDTDSSQCTLRDELIQRLSEGLVFSVL